MKLLSLIFLLSFTVSNVEAAPAWNVDGNPKVFIISENELLFEELSREYSMMIGAACDNDFGKASKEWLKMLISMERYADLWNYNQLDGVKVWMKVFCDKKGRIKHIAYNLKPNSRAVDAELFHQFLERFLRAYRMDVRSSGKYSHYTSISFPLQIPRN